MQYRQCSKDHRNFKAITDGLSISLIVWMSGVMMSINVQLMSHEEEENKFLAFESNVQQDKPQDASDLRE